MKWKKLKPFNGRIQKGCLNCGWVSQRCPLNKSLGVGFGDCTVTRDREEIYAEKPGQRRYPRLRKFEAMAKVDPDHDWRVAFFAPLYEAVFQRQGDGEWILIKNGRGFA